MLRHGEPTGAGPRLFTPDHDMIGIESQIQLQKLRSFVDGKGAGGGPLFRILTTGEGHPWHDPTTILGPPDRGLAGPREPSLGVEFRGHLRSGHPLEA